MVYHLCGGLMPLLEMVTENGADALETMTPPEMGGDCDLKEATRRVGDQLAFIGGFNQNLGFEKGTPEEIRKMVFSLHGGLPERRIYLFSVRSLFLWRSGKHPRFCGGGPGMHILKRSIDKEGRDFYAEDAVSF